MNDSPTLRFTVAGDPVPWTAQMRNAPRSLGFQKMQSWQKQIGAAARVAWTGKGWEPLRGKVELRMMFLLATHQITRRLPDGPDVTNMVKAAEDALQGIIFENDRQTRSVSATKWPDDRAEGMTIFWVRALDDSPTGRGINTLGSEAQA